jgi:hypothetical protein
LVKGSESVLKHWLVSLLICCSFITFAKANPSLDNELLQLDQIQEQLDLKRDWLKFRFDSDVQACKDLFFTTSCTTKAKKQLQREEKDLFEQENLLHTRQRDIKKALKDEEEQQRVAERADPKQVQIRANNRASFEEKQREKALREAEVEERRKDAAKRAQENRNTSPF